MSEYTTADAIQFAAQGEATKFRDAVDSVLMSKVGDAISVEKFNVAQQMFALPEEESDEDV